MSEFKLISMTDYVLKCEPFSKVLNYANFLKQPLKLSMFVPCDEDGKPLEKPKEHLEDRSLYYKELEQYQKALKYVLFRGFFTQGGFIRINEGIFSRIYSYEQLNSGTIEDFIGFYLTESAIKQIGL